MNTNEPIPPAKRWPNRPRLKDFDYLGMHAYHLVFNTALHKPVLVGHLATQVVDAIEQAAAATSFELLAYIVMPDHVHLLVQGRSDSAKAIRLVHLCKQRAGFQYKRATGEYLWLPSFFDRVVRRDDDAVDIAKCIFDNPMRAGLARSEERWPYSGGTLVEAIGGRS